MIKSTISEIDVARNGGAMGASALRNGPPSEPPLDATRPVLTGRPPEAAPTEISKIKVLLADDHVIVRQGVRRLLEQEPDLEVIGEADTGREAVQLAMKLRPDVVVMDLGMPSLGGLEATRQILEKAPGCKVLILSAHNEDTYIERAIELKSVGYLLKQDSIEKLREAIREMHNGKVFLGPHVSDRIQSSQRLDRQGVMSTKMVRLSPRELEVLQLIAEGKANKQTAAELRISVKTVEKHRQHIMEKLDIHDVSGLTRYAAANGIIELPAN